MRYGGWEWFERELAMVPPVLQERVRADVAPLATLDTLDEAADELVRVVQRRAQRMRETGACAERSDALDLLSLDALVTYTLGFVAEHLPDKLETYTAQLLQTVVGVTQVPSSRLA